MDNQPPAIAAPPGITVLLGTSSSMIGTATASDNCAIVTVSSNAPATFSTAGTVMVTWTATDAAGNTATATQLVTVNPVAIVIDIKPGSFPNAINPNSKRVIPIAILTTSGFDASTVDPSTVKFGHNGALAVHSAMQDVDGDGNLDLILQFRTEQTGIACGQTSATLTGKTLTGIPIEGSDSIKTVPCK